VYAVVYVPLILELDGLVDYPGWKRVFCWFCVIRGGTDHKGGGCWVRRLLWIGGRGGEEEHTTHPNDLCSPSGAGRERGFVQRWNPWPQDCKIDK
jgi:hypothetical protein